MGAEFIAVFLRNFGFTDSQLKLISIMKLESWGLLLVNSAVGWEGALEDVAARR